MRKNLKVNSISDETLPLISHKRQRTEATSVPTFSYWVENGWSNKSKQKAIKRYPVQDRFKYFLSTHSDVKKEGMVN